MLKKFPFGNINVTKNILFFFRYLQLITFNSRFLHELKTRFISLKLFVELSIFDSVSFSSKFIFLFNKKHGPFDFTSKIKTIEEPHTILLPVL